jgi:citrate lyase alpha subunit
MLYFPDRKYADIEPFLCEKFLDKLRSHTQPIQDHCMYTAEDVELFESVEDVAKRTAVKVVFGESFVHAFRTEADTAHIEWSVKGYNSRLDG